MAEVGLKDGATGGGSDPYTRIVKGDETERELIQKFELWFKESESLWRERKEWSENNHRLWKGEHIKTPHRRPKWRSNTVHNKQFENVETIVPIMTENVPVPVGSASDNEQSTLDAVRRVEGALKYLYRIDNLQVKSESIVRDMIVKRDAVATVGWDPTVGSDGDITVEVLDVEHVRVDPNSTHDKQGDYFFKVVPRSYRWVMSQWPEFKDHIRESFGVTESGDNGYSNDEFKNLEHMLPVKEVWYWKEEEDGEFNIWRTVYLNGKVLESDRNPYWDFEGVIDPEVSRRMQATLLRAEENKVLKTGESLTKEEISEISAQFEGQRRFNNFLPRQEFPYVIFPTFIDYKSPWSATSLVEQTAPLQTSLNKRKQQIDENANLMANGQWIADKNSGIEDHLFNNAPGAVYKKNAGSELRREPGVPLPSYVFEDMLESERSIDNIFGANDISKGQVGGAKTAREAILLKEADRGRVALLIRHYEMAMEKVYKWQLHLMNLFYEDERQVALFDSVGGIEGYTQISRDMIPDHMQIHVKVGSAKPIDQSAKRAEAIRMRESGLIDDITFFEQLGDYSDPREKAEMLDRQKRGTLFEQPTPSIEEQANLENDAILAGEDVQPHPDANPTHIQIHLDLLSDSKIPLTDKQIKKLEEIMTLEQEALRARNDEQASLAAQAPVPQDLAQQFPDQVPDEQLEQVVGQLQQ